MKKPTEMICAVIHASTQAPSVLHQVVIDPEKVKGNIIRLGDYPGDEYVGWLNLQHIDVIEVLGVATYDAAAKKVTVTPNANGTD